MDNLRQYIEQYVQDIQSILEQTKEAETDEKLVDLAEEKWFDPQNPKKTDPRLLVFLTAARRFPFEAGDTSAPDEGDKLNEVPQPKMNFFSQPSGDTSGTDRGEKDNEVLQPK